MASGIIYTALWDRLILAFHHNNKDIEKHTQQWLRRDFSEYDKEDHQFSQHDMWRNHNQPIKSE